MDERHENQAARKGPSREQAQDPGGLADKGPEPDRREGGGDGGTTCADGPGDVADLLALMPRQLRHLVTEPAALMRHERAAFEKELLVFWAVVLPQDAQEWWTLIKMAEQTVLALRYRRVEATLVNARARAILRAHLGGRHLKRPDKKLTAQDIEAHNDVLAERWVSGDPDVRPEVERLIRGVAREEDIWAQATEVVVDQFGALQGLAGRAEAAVRRALRDIGFLRNLKRLCDKEGVPWGAPAARPMASAGA